MGETNNLLDKAFEAFDSEKWTEAERLYRRALKAASGKEKQYKENAMHMLAFTLAMKEEFAEALSIYEKLLAQAHTVSDQAIALHQIGMVYRMDKKYDKAIEIFSKEKQLREQFLKDDDVGFSANAYEFGQIAYERDQLQEAFPYFTRALEYGKAADDLICIACAYRGLGNYYAKIGEQNKSIQSFNRSISAFEEAGDPNGAEKIHELLATIKI